MAAESENLDARMEAIRIKNEELEKKHKEIQEDEKLAAKQGALIDLKSQISASNDPSASHPYDKLDLDFDVKDSDKELAKDPSKTQRESPLVSVCQLNSVTFFFYLLAKANNIRFFFATVFRLFLMSCFLILPIFLLCCHSHFMSLSHVCILQTGDRLLVPSSPTKFHLIQ